MGTALALSIGLLAGAHTSTWGMFKDAPHEGFTYRKYFRSILVAALVLLFVMVSVCVILYSRFRAAKWL